MEIYETTIPVFITYLHNLVSIIDKAQRHVKQKKVSEKKLLQSRLAPDMFTFTQQVGYAYFMALETASNLSDMKAPDFGYDEKSLSELQVSLRRAIAFLKKIPRGAFVAAHKRRIGTFLDPNKKYKAQTYVLFLALPNFFFHVTTAYDLLRHMGVSLGKDDFLG